MISRLEAIEWMCRPSTPTPAVVQLLQAVPRLAEDELARLRAARDDLVDYPGVADMAAWRNASSAAEESLVAAYTTDPVIIARASRKSRAGRVRIALALNPACPSEVLAELYSQRALPLCQAVCAHPSCPPEVLADAAKLSSLRPAVASSPAITPEVAGLLLDAARYVLWKLADNPAVPDELVAALPANNPNALMRTLVGAFAHLDSSAAAVAWQTAAVLAKSWEGSCAELADAVLLTVGDDDPARQA